MSRELPLRNPVQVVETPFARDLLERHVETLDKALKKAHARNARLERRCARLADRVQRFENLEKVREEKRADAKHDSTLRISWLHLVVTVAVALLSYFAGTTR